MTFDARTKSTIDERIREAEAREAEQAGLAARHLRNRDYQSAMLCSKFAEESRLKLVDLREQQKQRGPFWIKIVPRDRHELTNFCAIVRGGTVDGETVYSLKPRFGYYPANVTEHRLTELSDALNKLRGLRVCREVTAKELHIEACNFAIEPFTVPSSLVTAEQSYIAGAESMVKR